MVTDGFAPRGYGEEGNRLFVNRGIGFSLLPTRLSAPPRVVIIELAPA